MKRSAIVWGGFGVLALATVGALVGCPASALSDCDNGNCDSPDGSGDGGHGEGGPGITDGNVNPVEGGSITDAPPGCDLSKMPKDSPACLDEGVGVFVDSNSTASTPDGSRAKPFKSIGGAVAGNTASRPRIYVCEGNYGENAAASNLDIYGGFTCAGGKWAYDGNKAAPTKVTGANDGAMNFAALHLTATKSVQITDIEFDEDNAPANGGGSSIAAWVEGAGSVTFTNVNLNAGTGADAPAAGAAEDNSGDMADLAGKAASGTTGGGAKTCTCKVFGKTTGAGGANAGDPLAGDGVPGSSVPAADAGGGPHNGAGGPGYGKLGGFCGSGTTGADGAPRTAGLGATTIGILGKTGWMPSAGGPAVASAPGQGGGGGGGGQLLGSGGGGCGGCGGGGGRGGGGGGASMALLVNGPTVTIRDSTLIAVAAGKGSAGGTGADGVAGGGSGASGGGAACAGGAGGNGGGGGGGGGGAGGVSLGIGYVASAPIKSGATVITPAATGGAHGAGGGGGIGPGFAGLTGLNGVDGVAAEALQLTAQ